MTDRFTPEVLSPIAENVPPELAERPQWVCWKLVERDGKATKVPFDPFTHERASAVDLMTWATFTDALNAYEAEGSTYDGIGFVFSSGDPYTGIDLDHVRDPDTGDIEEWALKIVNAVPGGYVEVSPSGSGIHIICEGSVRGGAVRKGRIEMYSHKRFFTITGREL